MNARTTSFLFALFSVGLGRLALAETLVVVSRGDSPDDNPGDGVCSSVEGCTLRAAIMEANALSGADTIELPAGEYKIQNAGTNEDFAASGDFDVRSGNLTIAGPAGAGQTLIDGTGKDRVFEVFDGKRLTLRGVTVTKGFHRQDGGGIYLHPGTRLFLGGASADNLPAAVIRQSSADGNGGAIYSRGGAVTVRSGSSVILNLAKGRGGAIYSSNGSVTVSASSLLQNESDLDGGAIASVGNSAAVVVQDASLLRWNVAGGSGGAIHNSGGSVTIDGASTLLENSAELGDGGGIANMTSGSVLVRGQSLLHLNEAGGRGGGIANADAVNGVRLQNSAIRGNTAGQGGGLFNAGLLLVTNGSLVADNLAQQSGGGLVNFADGPVTGVATVRGGPLGASVFARNSSSIAGAIENLGTLVLGEGTELTGNASGVSGGALVNRGTATLAGIAEQPILVLNNVSGPAAGSLTNRPGATLLVTHVNFERNSGANLGGAFLNQGYAEVSSSLFRDNSAGNSGAGIVNLPTFAAGVLVQAELTVTGSTFTGNTTSATGGAFVNAGLASVFACTFAGRLEGPAPGRLINSGVFAPNGSFRPAQLLLSECTFTRLQGGDSGAALVNEGVADLDTVEFTDNDCTKSGGALFNSGTLNVTSVLFSLNTAGDSGGAVLNRGALTISAGTFTANSAAELGGAIANEGAGVLELIQVVMEGNSAESGGALANVGDSVYLEACVLQDNSALKDGAGILSSSGTGRMVRGELRSNVAQGNGGGLYHSGTNWQFDASRIISNEAALNGGGIANSSAAFVDCRNEVRINQNSARGGGGVYNRGSLLLNPQILIRKNSSVLPGGGILNEAGIVELNGAWEGAAPPANIRENIADNIHNIGGTVNP